MSRTQKLNTFYHLAAEQQQALDWANSPMGELMLGSGREEFVQIAEDKLKEINEAKERYLKEEAKQ